MYFTLNDQSLHAAGCTEVGLPRAAHLRKAEATEADKSFHQGVTINLFRLHQVGLFFYWVKSNQLMEIVNNELKKVSSWFQANYKLSINIKESN